jgi:hypothetical protein
MSRPQLILAGDEAPNYVGEALALYRSFDASGRSRQTVELGVCIVLFEKGKITIIPDVSEFAIFIMDPSVSKFSSYFLEAVPAALPALTDSHLPDMPTFFPVYPGSLAVPQYDRVDIYDPGEAAPSLTVLFSGPILSSYGEYIYNQRFLLQPNLDTENQVLMLTYQLGGYLNQFDQPTMAKLVLAADTDNLYEINGSAMNVFPAVNFVRAGIMFRRLRGNTEQMVLCQQDDSTHSGQIYAIGSDGTEITMTPFGLGDLPAGARLDVVNPGDGARHVDYCYDIFTSERSQHYYVVKFVSDTAVEHNIYSINPYPGDLRLYPGGDLVVEKRLKSDLSLVGTYNLTPSTVDHQLQDVSPVVQIWNTANGDISGGTTGADIITRFVPYATGMVLVDAAGNEYPILPVLSCSQDWFWDSTAGVTSRENYIATGAISEDMKRNIFQQPALLWLGTPPDGFDGFTWPDVDAAGLKITAADAGLTNDVGIGGMRIWSSIIGDSDNILAQLLPYTGTDPGASTEQRIINAQIVDGLPVVTLKQVLNISQPVSMSDI